MKPVEEIAREVLAPYDIRWPAEMIGKNVPAWELAAAIATALRAERERAEKAENALVMARASAEGAGSLLLDVQNDCINERARAEKAEAERDEARELGAISDERHGALLRQSMRDHDALATARNRALEEAAARLMPSNPREDWTEYAKIRAECAGIVLSLHTPEATDG